MELKTGWGGRDRTYECRNQNPVPYHLATPQLLFCKIMQGMTIKSLRHKTLHTVWNLPQRRSGSGLGRKLGKNARARTRHGSHPRTFELPQPLEMTRYLRV